MKQNFNNLKNLILKCHFSNTKPKSLEQKLVQLFISCKQILTSYLRFIPFCGGQLFPKIISDALEVIIDSGNIASDLRFNTHNLPRDVKRLEQLFEKDKKVDLNTISLLKNLDKVHLDSPLVRVQPKRSISAVARAF